METESSPKVRNSDLLYKLSQDASLPDNNLNTMLPAQTIEEADNSGFSSSDSIEPSKPDLESKVEPKVETKPEPRSEPVVTSTEMVSLDVVKELVCLRINFDA